MNSKYYLSQKHFDEYGFSVVRNFIDAEKANLLYEYSKIVSQSISFKIANYPEKYDTEWDGNFLCAQAVGAYSKYGDPIMEALAKQTIEKTENYLGKSLYFTYAYWRLYQKNHELEKHTDRKSCDISSTICLGWDSSNLSIPYHWSFFVKSKNEDVEIMMNPGDAVFYRGCDLLHWRNKCEALNHAQVFFHYNAINENKPSIDPSGDGKYLDGRIALGVPKQYQRMTYPGAL